MGDNVFTLLALILEGKKEYWFSRLQIDSVSVSLIHKTFFGIITRKVVKPDVI